MDKERFKAAFSVVQAPDTLRMEVCKMTPNSFKPVGRILPKLLLAAVIVALLTTTAFATAKISDALKGGKAELDGNTWYAPTGTPNGEGPYDCYELYLDVEINPDAPLKIENYYMPVLDAEYVAYLGADLDQKATQFAWTKGLRNWKDHIMFLQMPGGTFDPDRAVASIFTPAGTDAEMQYITLGTVSGCLVEDTFLHARRHFYWSDGDYVFYMMVPAAYTDAQLTALVESVRYVPSIEPYLVDEETYNQIVYGDKN